MAKKVFTGTRIICGVPITQAYGDTFAGKLDIWIREPKNFWLKDFFIDHKITRVCIDFLLEKSEKLRDSYSLAKDIQESKIVKAAMGRKIDSTFAIFTLKNVAGWRDTPLVEINNNDTKLVVYFNENSKKKEEIDYAKNALNAERLS